MGSGRVCKRAPGVTCCAVGDRKAGNASRRDDRFVSLRNRADFQRVFRRARRVRSPGLTVLILEGPSAVPRLGIVAGKKVGNAVSRNRAKRRLREAAYRAHLHPHTDYILIASPLIHETGFTELVDTISEKGER